MARRLPSHERALLNFLSSVVSYMFTVSVQRPTLQNDRLRHPDPRLDNEDKRAPLGRDAALDQAGRLSQAGARVRTDQAPAIRKWFVSSSEQVETRPIRWAEVVRLQADLVSAQSQGPPAKPKKRKRFDQDPEPLPATDPTPATVHDFVAESDLTADHGLLFRLRELEKVIDSSATATTELASLSAVTHAASAIVDASTRLVRQCSTGGRVLPRTVDGARGTVVWSIEGVGAFRDKLADRTGRDVEDAVLQSRNTIRQKVSGLTLLLLTRSLTSSPGLGSNLGHRRRLLPDLARPLHPFHHPAPSRPAARRSSQPARLPPLPRRLRTPPRHARLPLVPRSGLLCSRR